MQSEMIRTGGAGFPTAAQDIEWLEEKEHFTPRIRALMLAVLAGEIDSCPGEHQGDICDMTASDIIDTCGFTDDADLMGKCFAAAVKAGLPEAVQMLNDYVDTTAGKLASGRKEGWNG